MLIEHQLPERARWRHADGSRVVHRGDGALLHLRGPGGAAEVVSARATAEEAAAYVAGLPGPWTRRGLENGDKRLRVVGEAPGQPPPSKSDLMDFRLFTGDQLDGRAARLDAEQERIRAEMRRLKQRNNLTREDDMDSNGNGSTALRDAQARAARIREVMQGLGPDCTLEQVASHLREDGIELEKEQFYYNRKRLWPEGTPARPGIIDKGPPVLDPDELREAGHDTSALPPAPARPAEPTAEGHVPRATRDETARRIREVVAELGRGATREQVGARLGIEVSPQQLVRARSKVFGPGKRGGPSSQATAPQRVATTPSAKPTPAPARPTPAPALAPRSITLMQLHELGEIARAAGGWAQVRQLVDTLERLGGLS